MACDSGGIHKPSLSSASGKPCSVPHHIIENQTPLTSNAMSQPQSHQQKSTDLSLASPITTDGDVEYCCNFFRKSVNDEEECDDEEEECDEGLDCSRWESVIPNAAANDLQQEHGTNHNSVLVPIRQPVADYISPLPSAFVPEGRKTPTPQDRLPRPGESHLKPGAGEQSEPPTALGRPQQRGLQRKNGVRGRSPAPRQPARGQVAPQDSKEKLLPGISLAVVQVEQSPPVPPKPVRAQRRPEEKREWLATSEKSAQGPKLASSRPANAYDPTAYGQYASLEQDSSCKCIIA